MSTFMLKCACLAGDLDGHDDMKIKLIDVLSRAAGVNSLSRSDRGRTIIFNWSKIILNQNIPKSNKVKSWRVEWAHMKSEHFFQPYYIVYSTSGT